MQNNEGIKQLIVPCKKSDCENYSGVMVSSHTLNRCCYLSPALGVDAGAV